MQSTHYHFMNRWWKKVVKDYFSFSKKERNGVFAMLFIGLAVYLFSRYYPVNKPIVKPDAFQQELATLKITIDSSQQYRGYSYKYKNDAENDDYDRSYRFEKKADTKGELFAFDPNTLDATGWQRLGLKDRTINIIQNFLAKGYKFKKPEDLQKIYGLKPEDAQRLMPYIQIVETAPETNPSAKTGSNPFPVKEYKPTILNINTADTTAFISLPGIGSKLASRIILYREKLGGFVSVNQIGETYGLPDSTFQKIKARFQCDATAPKQININTDEAEKLKSHPYIRWNIANAIVNYRAQHGNFKSVADLKNINLVTDDIFQKLKPYISL